MLLRRLLPSAAAVVALAIAASGCADQSAAVKVGDRSYSDSDFRRDLDAVAGNETMLSYYQGQLQMQQPLDPAGEAEGTSYSQDFVFALLNARARVLVIDQILARQDVEVTEDDLDGARSEIEAAFSEAGDDFNELPEGFRDRFVADYAAEQKLQSAGIPEDELNEMATEVSSSIDVNSRYGRFEQDEGFLPPESPLVQDNGESDDELQLPPG